MEVLRARLRQHKNPVQSGVARDSDRLQWLCDKEGGCRTGEHQYAGALQQDLSGSERGGVLEREACAKRADTPIMATSRVSSIGITTRVTANRMRDGDIARNQTDIRADRQDVQR